MAKKPQTVTADEALVELVAIEPIRLDGIDIAPGEVFAAPVDIADRLILGGTASVPLPPVLAE